MIYSKKNWKLILNEAMIRKGMNNESYLLEKELLGKQEELLSKEEIF